MLTNHPGTKKLPMIALIGVDGSGKSTVLSSVSKTFKHELVREVYILNRSSQKNVGGKPIRNYEKPPRSQLFSIAKLCYRAVLWTIRYYFKFFRMKHAGVLILCDHFSFLGIMLDPLKSRYGGPNSLARWILSVVPQPDVYIFLDAPIDVVYGRKQETTFDEMDQLIKRNRAYMSSISNGYIVDAANPVEHVTNDVIQKIIQIIEE